MTEKTRKIRLFLDQALAPGSDATLGREQAHYLFTVMRAEPGARFLVFNGRDGEFQAEVREAGKRAGRLALLQQTRPAETPPDLWLLFAPLKKSRTDFVVEKATELGVRRIQPALTRRTQAERVNLDRLRAVAIEAAEQCERVFAPEIAPPATLEAVLGAWSPARTLYFCDETRDAPPLPRVAAPGPAAVLIGPEGGFAPEEAAALRSHACVRPVALGPRVLRAETAAAAALSVWQACAGDWREEGREEGREHARNSP